jgi:hypothetical protein
LSKQIFFIVCVCVCLTIFSVTYAFGTTKTLIADVNDDVSWGFKTASGGTKEIMHLYGSNSTVIVNSTLNLHNNKITNVADPTNAQDVVTKNYTDTHSIKTVVTTSYTSGNTVTISGIHTGDTLGIISKGDVTGLLTSKDIQLTVAGSVVDTVTSSLGLGNQVPFALAYQYTTPSTSNVIISVGSTGG